MTVGTYAFGDIRFHPRYAESQPVLQPGAGLSSERVIPYSGAAILDLGGISAARHYGPIEIRIDPADEAGFEAMYQTSSTLTLAGAAYSRATLISLKDKAITPNGEYIWYSADWVVG